MSTVISSKLPIESGIKFVAQGTRMKWVSHVMIGYKYNAIATVNGIVQNQNTSEEITFPDLNAWLMSLPKGPGTLHLISVSDGT
jgi:hypothetical protein